MRNARLTANIQGKETQNRTTRKKHIKINININKPVPELSPGLLGRKINPNPKQIILKGEFPKQIKLK